MPRVSAKEIKKMRAGNGTNEWSKKAIRRSRWHKDENGRYHYAGICPFNNLVCRLRNYLEIRSDDLREGMDQ